MRATRRIHWNLLTGCLGLLALLGAAPSASAQWPTDFTSTTVGSGWQQPVGIAFAPSGDLFVWEKGGRVWSVVGGVKSAQPVVDIAEEVGNWRDHGLLGFAVDPDFAQNGRVYLGYVVDFHHLRWFGTPQYSPTTNEYFHDTIARVTRFTLDPTTLVLVPNSRAVLIGESMTTGMPICHQSHGMGSLVFGRDGTLLVTCGDGASYETTDTGGPTSGSSNTALADGIIRPKEDVGAFRAQLVDCLNGKVLRIDPATGDGVPSNPFYDSASPRAPRSRVWGMGLRNPYRMTLEPGTGSTDPSLGEPGTIWLGDVGWNTFEEADRCDGPARNFGWPLHEGLGAQGSYSAAATRNQDAPNRLFGTGGCTAQFFAFRDLLVQDTLGVPSWPNPCSPAQQIPASIPRFVHRRPVVDWGHGTVARAPSYSGNDATIVLVGAPGSPIQGPQFQGSCATSGAWYEGTSYPPEYQGSYFFADYVGGWIRRYIPGSPSQIVPFGTGGVISGVVNLVTAPGTGEVHYIRYGESGGSEVRRVVYAQNYAPVAVATPELSYGPVPLTVQFSSAGSFDPETFPITYEWNFGDGFRSTLPNPAHVFEALADITTQGSIIARVFELDPPHPEGGGNWNAQILRDGDYPPIGNTSDTRQYDTYHGGAQGNFDYLGYSFGLPRTFRTIVFQEGRHFSDGGWFDSWQVEIGDGTTWTAVPNAIATPSYPGDNGVSYETFRIDFPPTTGTHLRLSGVPGGTARFISAGELRVFGVDPSVVTQPARRDVTLTVRDPMDAAGVATTLVSLNNTPPVVTITSPIDGSLYTLGPATTIPLTATITDAQHTSIELECAWQTVLHHNTHSHPEPIDPNCATTTVITPEGCGGETYHFEVLLTVTDAGGLATTAVAHLYPDCAPTILCAGDGSGAACPCGNLGAAGRGCENSLATGGGSLAASGHARTSNDTLDLTATGLPPVGTALFFQGDDDLANGLGAPFGDGLRCAGGDVRRLGVRPVSAGTASFAPSGLDTLSAVGLIPAEGAVRTYQAWYRNAASFCTASTFNLTNGLRITWIP